MKLHPNMPGVKVAGKSLTLTSTPEVMGLPCNWIESSLKKELTVLHKPTGLLSSLQSTEAFAPSSHCSVFSSFIPSEALAAP